VNDEPPHDAERAQEPDAGPERLRVEVTGPTAHEGGDRSLYVRDPEGNVVEMWDFFHDGDGASEGSAALADDGS
jgi:hypothetical protein